MGNINAKSPQLSGCGLVWIVFDRDYLSFTGAIYMRDSLKCSDELALATPNLASGNSNDYCLLALHWAWRSKVIPTDTYIRLLGRKKALNAKKWLKQGILSTKMAERLGFEPRVRFTVHSISNAAHSATLTSLRLKHSFSLFWLCHYYNPFFGKVKRVWRFFLCNQHFSYSN